MAKIERTFRFVIGSAVVAVMAGCGGGDAGGEADEMDMVPMEEAAGPATVTIVSPADGAELDAGPVLVVMEVENLEIVEAGVMDAGTGHHHIFLDVDVTPMDEVIPAGVEGIIHKGDGTSVHLLEGVAPGSHRIIAVVADGMHVPLDPPVVDTVTFTVAGGGQ